MAITDSELGFNQEYWDNRYLQNQAGWDIGHVSTPLKSYFDQLKDKAVKILIPGAGNAYEAEYLFKSGFKNVHVLDFAETACKNFLQRVPDFPKDQLLCEDFFKHAGQYDLIIEQTFLSGLPPNLWTAYAQKMNELLKTNGTLTGVLFNDFYNASAPPFGARREIFLALFKPYFDIEIFDVCTNSILPRKEREFFMKMKKK